jgi:hypothetical protein
LRSWPARPAISRIKSRSTKRILRISAHLSTSSTSFPVDSVVDQARLRPPADGALRPSGFQADWQRVATPIDWRYTRRDLNDLLDRLNTTTNSPAPPDRTSVTD